jgi:hypothetical protein
MRVPHIRWYDTPESLLPRRIPELELIRLVIFGHHLGKKVDADSRLR